MNQKAEQHLSAAASYIAVAESGDAERSAYEQAALETQRAMKADPKLTQREIAKRLGKHESFVTRLLTALARAQGGESFSMDWQSGSNRRTEVAQKAFERPEAFAEMVEQATPELRQKIIEAVTDTSTRAGRLISKHVHEQDAEQRRKATEATQRQREDGALPLPAYMAAMVVKMTDWEAGLRALEEDLDGLPEGRGRELVGEAAQRLGDTAYRWADRLKRPKLTIIEGRKAG